MAEAVPKQSVTVRIAGEDHVLRSTAEAAYTRQCAEFLDDRVTEIRALSRLADPHRAIILAALSITDRYFQAQAELERVREEVTSRTLALAERVERELDSSAAAS